MDWLWALHDLSSNREFERTFGRDAHFEGLIITGKDVTLSQSEQDRLRWRQDNVLVTSRRVSCATLDQVCNDLDARLRRFEGV